MGNLFLIRGQLVSDWGKKLHIDWGRTCEGEFAMERNVQSFSANGPVEVTNIISPPHGDPSDMTDESIIITWYFCCSVDYDECKPMLTEHVPDCPAHSYCTDTYGSYTCDCKSGYKKHSDNEVCVSEGKQCVYSASHSAEIA